MSNYPAQIDNTISLPKVIDNLTAVNGLVFNRLRDAVLAIETELGVQPSTVYGSVRARLDVIENDFNNLQAVSLGGDLGGTISTPRVIGIQGRPISSSPPNTGDVLTWNGIAWQPSPSTSSSSTILSGDVSGIISANTVIKLQHTPVSSTAPTINQQLIYNGTQWIPTNSAVSAAQATWYIDPNSGIDTNNGLTSGTAIKTLAEFYKRTQFGNVWTITNNVDVFFNSYPPVTDPLRLRVKFYQNPSSSGPTLTFHPPTFTQLSTGTFSAVTILDRSTNTPWEVTDGTIDTSNDVKKRIRISSGPRAGSIAWVAKSTGAGSRRTSTFAQWAATNLGPTVITPQVGDSYVLESGANNGYLYVDFIEILPGSGAPFPNMCTFNIDGFDFRPIVDDAVTPITNSGCALDIANCAFWHGEWIMRTNIPEGDNASSFTVFENCGTFDGQNNLIFAEGTFIDNYVWGGLFGGALWPRQGGQVTIDFDALGQGNTLVGVPGLFINIGSSALVMSMGIMDMNANFGACIVQDGAVLGCRNDFSYSGNFGLWGTSANSGAFGVDIRGAGILRYMSGFPLTITGVGGDFKMDTRTVANAWDTVGNTYTTSFNCTWANLFGGSLKDNAHNLITSASAYLNASGNAQP